jgi:hypothetical protein
MADCESSFWATAMMTPVLPGTCLVIVQAHVAGCTMLGGMEGAGAVCIQLHHVLIPVELSCHSGVKQHVRGDLTSINPG